jgi:hypothetical protein
MELHYNGFLVNVVEHLVLLVKVVITQVQWVAVAADKISRVKLQPVVQVL